MCHGTVSNLHSSVLMWHFNGTPLRLCPFIHPTLSAAAEGFAAGISPHRCLHSFFSVCFKEFFPSLRAPFSSHSSSFTSLVHPTSTLTPPHFFFPTSIPKCISVVYTRFLSCSITVMDLNTSPPSLHPCSFLEEHLGPPLSLSPPYCLSFSLLSPILLSFQSLPR